MRRVNQAQVQHKIFSTSSSSDFPNSESAHLCADVSDLVACDLMSQNTDHYNRLCHLPLQTDSCLPHSTFVCSGRMEEGSDDIDNDVFCKAATNLPHYNQSIKSRPAASREGISHTESPLEADMCKDEMTVLGEIRTARDVVCPVACNKLPEETFN